MKAFLLNCLLIIAAPLFFRGFADFVRTRGRLKPHGTVREFLKLLGEGVRAGNDTSFIYETASSLILASIIMAGTLVPLIGHRPVLNFENSGILFFSFLLLEKIVRTVGGRFPAGKNRKKTQETFFGMLPETAFYLLLMSACWLGGTLSFEKLFAGGLNGSMPEVVSRLVFLAVLFVLLLREEESGADGYRGSDRAVVVFSGGLKEFLFAALIAGFVLPNVPAGTSGMNEFLYLILFLAVLTVIAAATGLVRSWLDRLKSKFVVDAVLIVSLSAAVVLSVIVPYI